MFTDAREHWEHAVLRLLRIGEDEAKSWVETVADHSSRVQGKPFQSLLLTEKIDTLRLATHEHFDLKPAVLPDVGRMEPFQGLTPDVVWAADVDGERRFAVVGSIADGLAWLVDLETAGTPTTPTVEYDESYFQGGDSAAVGYGDYEGQRWWREEKANRQLREVRGLATYLGAEFGVRPRALDVGAGFGFFRQALEEAGWEHEGVELSDFANDVCRDWFGFESFRGTLAEYAESTTPGFDLVTLWDVVEHVWDPQDLLRVARSLARVGGLVCVRTPNIDALEREVFGSAYHSFKREHLVYFSPRALARNFEEAGLTAAILTTQAHLLQGFLGPATQSIAGLLRGSDIVAVARRVQ